MRIFNSSSFSPARSSNHYPKLSTQQENPARRRRGYRLSLKTVTQSDRYHTLRHIGVQDTLSTVTVGASAPIPTPRGVRKQTSHPSVVTVPAARPTPAIGDRSPVAVKTKHRHTSPAAVAMARYLARLREPARSPLELTAPGVSGGQIPHNDTDSAALRRARVRDERAKGNRGERKKK